MKSSFAMAAILAVSSLASKSLKFDLERVPFEHPLLTAGSEVYSLPSASLQLKKSGYRYQAPVYFGSAKNPAIMSFDTGSSYTTVTSDLCTNCSSKSYKPGTSETTVNLN